MFVILQPHSNSNPTDKYRVVDGIAWTSFVNGAQNNGYTIAGEHKTYDDAEVQRDELNKGLKK